MKMQWAKRYSQIVWLVMMAVSLMAVANIIECDILIQSGFWPIFGTIGIAAIKATVFTLILELSVSRKWMFIVVLSLGGIYIFLTLLHFIGWLAFGFGISRTALTIIYETNRREITEFLPMIGPGIFNAFSRNVLLSISGFLIALDCALNLQKKYYRVIAGVLSLVGIIYVATDYRNVFRNSLAFTIWSSAKGVVQDVAKTRSYMANIRPLPYADSARSDHRAANVVVIIGESASRDHLSLYGYPLKTTPRMDAIADSLFVFNDAVASSFTTSYNMPRLLSFMPSGWKNAEEERPWYEYPSVFTLFKRFGYHTEWISNQEKTGNLSNLSAILAQSADRVKYVGKLCSDDVSAYRCDELLLPYYFEAIRHEAPYKLIFLHLLGSHSLYYMRYPENRQLFTAEDELPLLKSREWIDASKARTIACYDSSIAYTDSIIDVVRKSLAVSKSPCLFVYLSDHGQLVYDDRDYDGRDERYVRVPFVIYANDVYRKANPDLISIIAAAVDRPFSTADMIYMLISLTGSEYMLYDSRRDPVSPDFQSSPRYVDCDVFGERGLKELPVSRRKTQRPATEHGS